MDESLTLTTDMILVFGLVGFTMAMFMTERLRPDLTALMVLITLGLLGLVPADRLFAGFAGNAVISVMATMILGAGLERTGALNRLAVWLLRRSKGLEERLILFASAIGGMMSSSMQNPAVMTLFLPVTSRLSNRTGLSLSRLLLPIGAAVVMGGGLTMVGNSPLILLNDLLLHANDNLPSGAATLAPFAMFAPMPVGLALLGASLLYFRFFGARMLEGAGEKSATPGRTDSYFAQTYGITGEVFELTVTSESPLVGMSIGEAEAQHGAPLFLALKSGQVARLAPPADEMLWVGSVIGVMGTRREIGDYAQNNLLRQSSRLRNFGDLFNPSRAGVSEAVIPPNSAFIGKTIAELHMRRSEGISVLAVNRDNEVFREDVRQLEIKAGDLLVFHSIWTDLAQAASKRDFVVVTDYPKEEQRPHKLWVAIGIFAAAVGLALSAQVAVPIALMTGAATMLIAGVLNMDEAYHAVNWKTVFIMACLIPLGWAMDSTGAAAWLAQEILTRLPQGLPVWAFEAAIAVLSTVFALVITNVGATVVMVPIAINFALAVGGNPATFALVVALSAANNFLSASNPVLAMISAPGGYSSRDFLRIGGPLMLVYLGVTLLVVNLLW
ncbi:SLC13 family permease [Coralloluteibacterium stylophorae]|uniref:SLC13 family permease n=1 Tax=Coralloluteibacterium stylophorae TaxID=1776034 RepID=A0A8J7VWQ4_9GAMM|nr:SLC13 family permease [Coralloluteibacterium stylophorae]MBS7458356.1 SLC13 family permease [Coralloluteibacterium stylophorae]